MTIQSLIRWSGPTANPLSPHPPRTRLIRALTSSLLRRRPANQPCICCRKSVQLTYWDGLGYCTPCLTGIHTSVAATGRLAPRI